jgi:S1-C subfamily serine protease
MTDSAVHLLVEVPDGVCSGTGFVVAPEGLVVTNAHVVAGGGHVEALLGPGRGSADAVVLAVDEDADIAVLALQDVDAPPPPLPLGASAGLPPLRSLIVLGNAQVSAGEPPRVVEARVARNHAGDRRHFETDGAIEPGFSGGPVVDPVQGAVVGVVVGGRGQAVRVIVRVERVRELLELLGHRVGGMS